MPRHLTTARAVTRNLPIAIVVAGGLAAGIGLARPATSSLDAGPSGTPSTEPAPAGDSEPDRTGSYRRGDRTAGARSGAASSEGAAPAPPPAPADDDGERAAEAEITIEGFAYDGATTVSAGTPISVTNRDGVPHTLSFRTGDADTGTVDGGSTALLTAPSTPGTYAYFCRIHPAMAGEIEITG